MQELEQKVIEWAQERGIFEKATPYKQAQKTLEETGELLYAIGKQFNARIEGDVDGAVMALEEIRDAIGDVLVTLAIQARMQGLDLESCFESAYNEIKDRKGKMVGGQFVKEA